VTLAAPDGAYDPATGIWTIGNLPVGASTTLSIVVTVDEAGTITNEAEVTAANEVDVDSVPGDGQGDDWDDAVVEASQVLASGTIGDTVWYDEDKDGIQDSGEEGVSGVTIRLTNQDTNEVSTQVTNASGRYLFAALDPGTYVVSIVMSTAPESTALTTAGSFTVNLDEGESFLAADFGLVGSLPRTGVEIGTVALLGLAMLAAGGALLLATRKRRSTLA
jgi:LPXTG-motif cell wall-anchored protein